MGTGHHLSSELAGFRPLLSLGQPALDSGKSSLLLAEELRWSDSLSSGERGKGVKANIYTNRLLVRPKPLRFTLTGEGYIPFANIVIMVS